MSDVSLADLASTLRHVEELRRAGYLEQAFQLAIRALERHPYEAAAHDALARVHAARGHLERAADEWEMAARLDPTKRSAQRGLAYVAFRSGRLDDAERHLNEAGDIDEDSPARRQLRSARAGSAMATARSLFDDELGDGATGAMLMESDGVVLAGSCADAVGRPVADEVAAQLAGVSTEAERTLRDLDLGEWRSITVESSKAALLLAPAADGRMVLIATPNTVPLGRARLLLTRAVDRARDWLGGAR